MTPKQFEGLGQVTVNWLDYQIGCGRGPLLCEHSLAQPTGEFLLGRHPGAIESEYSYRNHGKDGQKKRGRPRQIDYALFSRDTQDLIVALEVKWAGSTLPTTQGLVNDVMRLESIRSVPKEKEEEGKARPVDRYFMLAGTKARVDKMLGSDTDKGNSIAPAKIIDTLLPRDKEPKTIDIENIEDRFQRFFRGFARDYKVDLPKKIRVSLITDSSGTRARVLVWRILSVGRRTEFSPSEHGKWHNSKGDSAQAPKE